MILDPMFPARQVCSGNSAKIFLEEDLVLLSKSVIENGL